MTSRAPGPFTDGLLQMTVSVAGIEAGTSRQANLSSAFTATKNSTTGAIDIGLSASGASGDVVAAIAGQDIAPASVAASTYVSIGSTLLYPGTATTTGTGSSALVALPVPDNRGVPLTINAVALSTIGYGWLSTSGVALVSGSLTTLGFGELTHHAMGLPPSISTSWSAGTLTFTAHGPAATIAGTQDNGSGKLQVLVHETRLSPELDGMSVTIAGLSGTPGGNGAHVATNIATDSFDLVSVNFVAPDSSGTVALTTPPTLKWTAFVIGVVGTM